METLGIIELAGFVALLLWGLHMVQAGILDAYGADIRKILRHGLRNRLVAFMAGLGVTTALQSSTATGLVAAGFTATGVLDLGAGLAVMLGANVGTTLIVQLLSFNIAVFAPILVLIGVMGSRLGRTDRQRDVAKAAVGLGLMLFALTQMPLLLGHAAGTDGFRTLLGLVTSDTVASLLLAAILAWAMHSSAAVVLLVMSFSQQGLVSLPASFALVLGANLGSAVNPVLNMLSRKDPAALRLPLGNLLFRVAGCGVALALLDPLALNPHIFGSAGHAPANFHLVFNLAAAVLFLPFLPILAKWLPRWLPEAASVDAGAPAYLDAALVRQPDMAIAAAAREVMRMADVAERMLADVAVALREGGQGRIDAIRRTDDTLDRLNHSLKVYLTSIPANTLSDSDHRRLDQVLSASMTLEQVGDIVSNNLARRAGKLLKRRQTLSPETWMNLKPVFDGVTGNIRLTASVFMTGEKRAAKRLLEEKQALDLLEAKASRIHLDRLRQGSVDGIETSAMEIDTLHDLRQINDHLAAIATGVLQMRDKRARERGRSHQGKVRAAAGGTAGFDVASD